MCNDLQPPKMKHFVCCNQIVDPTTNYKIIGCKDISLLFLGCKGHISLLFLVFLYSYMVYTGNETHLYVCCYQLVYPTNNYKIIGRTYKGHLFLVLLYLGLMYTAIHGRRYIYILDPMPIYSMIYISKELKGVYINLYI